MSLSRLSNRLVGWIRRPAPADPPPSAAAVRGARDHVIIIDGTLSSLDTGHATNAGRAYRLVKEQGHASVYYEAGLQWGGVRTARDVMTGRGINRQICRAYGFLASRYRPGDRIFLLGYSRGAYAVRSLAGVIDRVGLLRADAATERNIRQIYRLYRFAPEGETAQAFAKAHCHAAAPVEMVGVWDTVKALGVRLPLLWRWSEPTHAFHNHALGPTVRHGFHALALDETRQAYEPVLWDCPDDWTGVMEQVWFQGTHGDVGGQLGGFLEARGLSNIPLVWILERAEACGLALPHNWRGRFDQDPAAPSIGKWHGLSKLFWLRKRRAFGYGISERLHESVQALRPEVLQRFEKNAVKNN